MCHSLIGLVMAIFLNAFVVKLFCLYKRGSVVLTVMQTFEINLPIFSVTQKKLL